MILTDIYYLRKCHGLKVYEPNMYLHSCSSSHANWMYIKTASVLELEPGFTEPDYKKIKHKTEHHNRLTPNSPSWVYHKWIKNNNVHKHDIIIETYTRDLEHDDNAVIISNHKALKRQVNRY